MNDDIYNKDNPKNHKWSYCPSCDVMMVICGTCGNNSCNAGRGSLENGEPCPDCDESIKYFENTPTPPKPDNYKQLMEDYDEYLWKLFR